MLTDKISIMLGVLHKLHKFNGNYVSGHIISIFQIKKTDSKYFI